MIEIVFFEYINQWRQGKVIIPPLEQSWNYFFKQVKNECVILDKFEFKAITNNILNTHSIYIIEDDYLWHESIPFYENGNFHMNNTNRLYSISSLKEASKTYENLFKDGLRFGGFLDSLFTILNREKKLKEIGI